jgi:hypothetical protein
MAGSLRPIASVPTSDEGATPRLEHLRSRLRRCRSQATPDEGDSRRAEKLCNDSARPDLRVGIYRAIEPVASHLDAPELWPARVAGIVCFTFAKPTAYI